MSNLWKKKIEEQGINPDNFVDLALAGGKLTDVPEPVELPEVQEQNESAGKVKAGSLEALLQELKDIESGKKKAGNNKKISVSIDAVAYLKLEIIKKKIEEGFFMEVPLSKVVSSAIDEQYETKYRKTKKVKAP